MVEEVSYICPERGDLELAFAMCLQAKSIKVLYSVILFYM